MPRRYFVYILASHRRALYIGVTNDMDRRLDQHRSGAGSEFVQQYKAAALVHVEVTESVRAAIEREKQLKGWRREKKIRLIEEANPMWKDLSLEM
jgi:putative endonuclease